MTHSDPLSSKESGNDEAVRDADEAGPSEALPAAARRTLEEIADALGVTTSLLSRESMSETHHDGDSAKLVEAATLLQAFIRISSPALRRRCIAFVQDAVEQDRNRT